MQGFEWAKAQLGVRTPYDLESKGVTVFFAPHIQDDVKVVDLADGRVVRYPTGEPRRVLRRLRGHRPILLSERRFRGRGRWELASHSGGQPLSG